MSAKEVAAGRHTQLQEAFDKVFMAASGPQDMAMFGIRRRGDGDLFEYLFSPEAARIAAPVMTAFQGQECNPPKKGDVALLVGHADAVERLLSD